MTKAKNRPRKFPAQLRPLATFFQRPLTTLRVPAEAAAIAAFAGLPITGAINATVTSDGSVSISSPGAATLVGVCVPLIWNAQTNQVEVDLGKTLLYANGVANDVNGSNLQRAIRFKTIRFKTIR